VFTPVELAGYRALASVDKQRRFYELWTLKEAILKADGRGLAIPLTSFQFHLDREQGGSQPYFEVTDTEHGPAPGPWQFQCYRLQNRHQVAVAIATSHDVAFQCHNIHLSEYDSDFAQPWRFTLASNENQEGPDLEFGVYSPYKLTPPTATTKIIETKGNSSIK
jgi:phosphopantetheinyl transferase (holo-ACP synthase)